MKYLTVSEVMQLFRISRMTVYRWIKEGKLISYQVGRKHLLKESELPTV